MFETPYQTSPCSRFDMTKTHAGIRRLEIENELVPAVGFTAGVKLVPPGVDAFQPFNQPITKLDVPTLEASVIVDGRSLLRVDKTPLKQDVYKYALLNATLVEMWYTQGASMKRDMLNLGNFPAKVFINWLSGAVTTRLGLDFGQGLMMRVLTAVYYIQLFGPLPEHPTEDDIDRLLVRVARLIPGVEVETVRGLLDEIPRLNNIKEFIAWVIVKMDTPRLHQVSVDYVYTALGYNFGPQYREAVAVSLEYPPTFIAMVYTACVERTYQKSGLGRIIERLISRGDDKEFVKNVQQLTGLR